MKTGEDFRREFLKMDAGFEAAAQAALDCLPESRARRHVLQWAVVFAMLMALLATAAVAAGVMRWSAADFIDASRLANITAQSEAILEAGAVNVPISIPCANLLLRQAVYDGMAVYLLFEAVPVQDGFMVAMGAERMNGDQAVSHGSAYPKDTGIREYASQQGYNGVTLLEIFSGETTASLFDSAVNEDGTFSLMVWAFVKPEYRCLPELTLNLQIQDAADHIVISDMQPIQISLPLAGKVCTRACTRVTPIPEAGLTVTGITAYHTAMTSYILVDYEVTDTSAYNRNLFYSDRISLTDAQGCVLLKGTHPLSLLVDRSVQGMGDGPYYITNRQMSQEVQEIILEVDDNDYAFMLQ